jgi:hypothetical protein
VNVLKLPLASEAVDRSGELRLKPDELAKLWKSARILHFASGKFRVKENYELDFQSADQIAQLRTDAKFAHGETRKNMFAVSISTYFIVGFLIVCCQ